MTVGTSRLVKVKVESCLGSQPICSTRLPSLDSATDRFDEVVLLPMPPLPYTENTLAVPIVTFGSSCTCTLPAPSARRSGAVAMCSRIVMFMRLLPRLRGDLRVLRRPCAAHPASQGQATNSCAHALRSGDWRSWLRPPD